MNVLVTYDVSTQTAHGRKRLRQVAKACEGFGQRVQLSVFECALTRTQFEVMRGRLSGIIDPKTDSLRIYRLETSHKDSVEVYGRDSWIDLSQAIIL